MWGDALQRFESATCNLKGALTIQLQGLSFGLGISYQSMNEVCFIISEAVQSSAISACAEHKTLFMNRIWPDGVFTPIYLSYAFPDLYVLEEIEMT